MCVAELLSESSLSKFRVLGWIDIADSQLISIECFDIGGAIELVYLKIIFAWQINKHDLEERITTDYHGSSELTE